jgi:hypothetical protein
MMQRVATRARALGVLAAYALAQSTSQPDLFIIVRHLADQAARFWCSFLSAASEWKAGCTVLLHLRSTNHLVLGNVADLSAPISLGARTQ